MYLNTLREQISGENLKNKDFFYLQYNKIDWQNQEKTKINALLNNHIIQKIILKNKNPNIAIFDIGFGIGFFFKTLCQNLPKYHKTIILEGCEPSEKNYQFFLKEFPNFKKNVKLKTHNNTFLNTKTDKKFDFVTAIYVFPHFIPSELEKSVKKIHSILNKEGKFILVVANVESLQKRLETKKDLFIENNIIEFDGKKYKETLHYSDIPKIGKVIDYNRAEPFYADLFEKNKFNLVKKTDLNDSGFICTIFVFEKN